MSSDKNLRDVLVHYRETYLCADINNIDDRCDGLLRRRMIDWLVAEKPKTLTEWITEVPPRIWQSTDPNQFALHGEAVIRLIRSYSHGGTGYQR